MKSIFSHRIVIGAVMLGATAFAATVISYHLTNTYKFGAAPGDREYFDYITFDPDSRRLYLTHGSEVLVVNDDDEPGLHKDYGKWLEKLAPHEPTSAYAHNHTGEDNADAHMKRQIMGREVVVAVTNSQLDFGPWEQIFYGEFDGRRKKRVLVKIIGE